MSSSCAYTGFHSGDLDLFLSSSPPTLHPFTQLLFNFAITTINVKFLLNVKFLCEFAKINDITFPKFSEIPRNSNYFHKNVCVSRNF